MKRQIIFFIFFMKGKNMNFHMPTKVIFGSGVLSSLNEVLKNEIKATRPMLITDKGLRASGLVDKVIQQIGAVDVFDEIEPNPKSDTVNRAAILARQNKPDVIIALGGGSPLDAAKAIALLATNEGIIEDYEGRAKYKNAPLPLIAIPTTCGTGSEVTWVAVITDIKRKFKMSVKGPKMFPNFAIVDPDLLRTLPIPTIAATGMDALTHAIEAYTVKPATFITDMIALESIKMISESLEAAVQDIHGNKQARENLMYGSTIAGFAFGNSDVGGVHCISESIGALFDVPHGVANAIFLPYVMEYNLPECVDRFAEIAAVMGIKAKDKNIAAQKLLQKIRKLSRAVKIPSFRKLKIKPQHFEKIAQYSFQNNSNPSNARAATAQDYLGILQKAAGK
ncbi:MAG: iron-containing alcohol dehydrogenase [Desulfobacteraceae bacterium]|nr:MAG: iron-containing alcohol dehydrogenase [Desulfobacteraceae bacterium]